MNVPYNTGKIRIGCFYTKPPQRPDQSADMSRLQTALLLLKKPVFTTQRK